MNKYAKRTVPTALKDIALFFAAPFIALAYLALFPFMGLAMLHRAWKGQRAGSR